LVARPSWRGTLWLYTKPLKSISLEALFRTKLKLLETHCVQQVQCETSRLIYIYMANKWKDKGECNDPLDKVMDVLTFGTSPKTHLVENEKTGELKEVIVGHDETIGKAIEKGQWKKK